jgi:DNA adenine methylase
MIPYVGGKSRIADWIIGLFPEHSCYVEVFGGGGWVLHTKEPSGVEVYNDIDKDLINLFQVLRNPEKSKELYRRFKWTLHSRADFLDQREMWRLKTYKDEIEHAFCFAYYMCAGRQGKRNGMSFKINKSTEATAPASLNSFCRRIITARRRLKNVIIESLDFEDLINKYDSPEAFFYCDPPYIKSDYYYCVNWTMEDHKRLADTILQIKGKFALSYYDSDLVRQLYPGCYFSTKDVRISVQHHVGHGKMQDTEIVITNYEPCPHVEQNGWESFLQEKEVSA